jgi:hypothetical protein
MLIETFPDLPAFCRIPTEERRQAWAGIELRPSCGTIALGRTVIYDPSTEQVRLDAEARQAQRREAELLKKRDAEAVRKRGIKNVKILALAIAGKVRLPPEPIKIVRVIDLNPLGQEPAKQETTMTKAEQVAALRVKRATAKGPKPAKRNPKLPSTHPANRGPKERAKAATAKARTPAKPKAATRAPKGVREGSKLALVVGLLKRKEGCTAADVLTATDWPAVSMPQQARAAGLTLRQEKDGKVTRYWAA